MLDIHLFCRLSVLYSKVTLCACTTWKTSARHSTDPSPTGKNLTIIGPCTRVESPSLGPDLWVLSSMYNAPFVNFYLVIISEPQNVTAHFVITFIPRNIVPSLCWMLGPIGSLMSLLSSNSYNGNSQFFALYRPMCPIERSALIRPSHLQIPLIYFCSRVVIPGKSVLKVFPWQMTFVRWFGGFSPALLGFWLSFCSKRLQQWEAFFWSH